MRPSDPPSSIRAPIRPRFAKRRTGWARSAPARWSKTLLADVGASLLADGFTRFVVAGGETSGAVVGALGVKALEIGPEIDPGVPWTRSLGTPDVALALKSGNFGAPDFFLRAWTKLS